MTIVSVAHPYYVPVRSRQELTRNEPGAVPVPWSAAQLGCVVTTRIHFYSVRLRTGSGGLVLFVVLIIERFSERFRRIVGRLTHQ